MDIQRQLLISQWFQDRYPAELRALAAANELSREELEYGFALAIEMGKLDWLDAFAYDQGCSLDRFLESPQVYCPLTYAVVNGMPSAVSKLLELGADPNILINKESGHRPLHVAVDHESTSHVVSQEGEKPVVFTELLISFGADPLLRDYCGQSPLDIARIEDHQAAIRLLEKAAISRALKRQGIFALARRIIALAQAGPAKDVKLDALCIDDPVFLRRLVDLTARIDFSDWVDDDLIRQSNWFVELSCLEDAEAAASTASESHPERARALIAIAERYARERPGQTTWRGPLTLALQSFVQIKPVWVRIELAITAAALLVRLNQRDEAFLLLITAREAVLEVSPGRERDQAAASLCQALAFASFRREALKTAKLIEDSKLRWVTRKRLLQGVLSS